MLGHRLKPLLIDSYITAYQDSAVAGNTTEERWRNFLAQQTGKTGSQTYLENEYLKKLGYSGTMADMVKSWTSDEDGLRGEFLGTQTNLVTNPSFEVDLTGWSSFLTTITRDTTQFYQGVASMKAVADAGQEAVAFFNLNYIPGRTYVMSARVKGTAGQKTYLASRSNTDTSANPVTLTGGWDLVRMQFVPTTAASSVEVKLQGSGGTMYVDKVQLFVR